MPENGSSTRRRMKQQNTSLCVCRHFHQTPYIGMNSSKKNGGPVGRHSVRSLKSLVGFRRRALVLRGRVGVGYLNVVLDFQTASLVLGNLLSRFLFVAAGDRAIQLEVFAVHTNSDIR